MCHALAIARLAAGIIIVLLPLALAACDNRVQAGGSERGGGLFGSTSIHF
jgi:hypothetical protein